MQRHSILASLLLAMTTASLAAVAPQSAAGASKPTLAVQVAQLDAGAQPVLRYTVAAPRGARISMQRAQGTRRAWRTFTDISRTTTGTVTAPAIGQGVFTYRVAVEVRRHGRYQLVARSAAARAYGYASVPMRTVTQRSGGNTQIGQQLFEYALEDSGPDFAPEFDTVFSADTTTCRSFALTVAAANVPSYAGGMVASTIVQTRSDPQSLEVTSGQVAPLAGLLDGGPWRLTATTLEYATKGSQSSSFAVFYNGTLSCYSPSGR